MADSRSRSMIATDAVVAALALFALAWLILQPDFVQDAGRFLCHDFWAGWRPAWIGVGALAAVLGAAMVVTRSSERGGLVPVPVRWVLLGALVVCSVLVVRNIGRLHEVCRIQREILSEVMGNERAREAVVEAATINASGVVPAGAPAETAEIAGQIVEERHKKFEEKLEEMRDKGHKAASTGGDALKQMATVIENPHPDAPPAIPPLVERPIVKPVPVPTPVPGPDGKKKGKLDPAIAAALAGACVSAGVSMAVCGALAAVLPKIMAGEKLSTSDITRVVTAVGSVIAGGDLDAAFAQLDLVFDDAEKALKVINGTLDELKNAGKLAEADVARAREKLEQARKVADERTRVLSACYDAVRTVQMSAAPTEAKLKEAQDKCRAAVSSLTDITTIDVALGIAGRDFDCVTKTVIEHGTEPSSSTIVVPHLLDCVRTNRG